jgi:hypothetical protein
MWMTVGEPKGPVRRPAVAGLFYPAEPEVLRREVERHLAAAEPPPFTECPRALIAPHAGYIYSGPVAASAYACWARYREQIDCVVLVGPSHRHWFSGLALPDASAFSTPLGDVRVDAARAERVLALPGVQVLDAAHTEEHSLEVHLPFLQVLLDEFTIVPLVVGQADAATVAAALDTLRADPATVLLISSDLSHYHNYADARHLDGETSNWIEHLDGRHIDGEHACGCRGIGGLLQLAAGQGWQALTLDLRNSGDTAGNRDQVVGYGAWAFSREPLN